jgi:hypothetical protein
LSVPSAAYRHYFLKCPSLHGIEIPRPKRLATDGDFREIATENRRAIFACPYCGVVSAYYGREIQEILVETLDPFLKRERSLVYMPIECEGVGCEAPKIIHTIIGTPLGTWNPTVTPKDWYFSDSAVCECGHKLRFDESRRLHVAETAEVPF